MIRYRLQCDKDHAFDAWFGSSAAYERQREAALVTCPTCGSSAVEKAIMAPNVTTSERHEAARERAAPRPPDHTEPAGSAVAVANADAAAMAERTRHMVELIRKLRAEVKANAEYVGPRFAEEARRIHFEETEPKGIYGEASLDDVRALHEDGIPVLPLPELPEDKN